LPAFFRSLSADGEEMGSSLQLGWAVAVFGFRLSLSADGREGSKWAVGSGQLQLSVFGRAYLLTGGKEVSGQLGVGSFSFDFRLSLSADGREGKKSAGGSGQFVDFAFTRGGAVLLDCLINNLGLYSAINAAFAGSSSSRREDRIMIMPKILNNIPSSKPSTVPITRFLPW